MKYFHINGKIDGQLLISFYDFCNQYSDDDWTISVQTIGGHTTVGKNILHIINGRPDRCTLICHEAYSSGFELLYMSKCKKVLSETCKGMVHKSSAEFVVNSDIKPVYLEDICVVKNWKESTTLLKMVTEFLTKKELREFNLGNEVYFTTKRMKEIFPDAEII